MVTLFADYRLIPAESIIRSNIRAAQVNDDLTSLLDTLRPLKMITNLTSGSRLNRTIVDKFAAKTNTLDLLEYYGYRRDGQGDYVYQTSTSSEEAERRHIGVVEFEKLFDYLKNARTNGSDDLKRFLQGSVRQYEASRNEEYEDRRGSRPKYSSPIIIPPAIPLTQHQIDEGNRQTIETVQSLKRSLVTQYNTSPSHGFIRRKIAMLLLKQQAAHLSEADDNFIDQTVDQHILELKHHDNQANGARTDNVYLECLIRSSFNQSQALHILNNNPPNLAPPVDHAIPNKPVQISMNECSEHLQRSWQLLNQPRGEDNRTESLPYDDEWRNIEHLIPAIQQLHQRTADETTKEVLFSKMYRLFYSELSRTIGPQLAAKIEIVANMLCQSPEENVDNLDTATLKNILSSSDGFHDGFESHAMSSLSMSCPICTVSYPRTQIETMLLCNHMACLDCVKGYYRQAIYAVTDSRSLNQLTCFQEAHEITPETELNFFPYLGSKLRQWFLDEPEVLERYHTKLIEAASVKQMKKCGGPRCQSYFIADGDGDDIEVVRCPDCNFAQCRQCTKKWYPEHAELDCDEYIDWLAENDPDDDGVRTWQYLRETAIVCPNDQCGAIYQYKAGGCEHFTCPQCHTDFCRMCSTLFHSPLKHPKCERTNCGLRNTLHAHCTFNCFRETRIAEIAAIVKLLTDHDVNVTEELRKQPISQEKICPTGDCGQATATICEDRLCERCYKQLLCGLIWRHQIEPWEIYEDNNLQQMLAKATVAVPENSTRDNLIDLCKQKLVASLGKPRKLKRPKS